MQQPRATWADQKKLKKFICYEKIYWEISSPTTSRNWEIQCVLFTLTARNRNLIEQTFSYFFPFCNTFFCTQLSFVFRLLRDSSIVQTIFLLFFSFLVWFWYFSQAFWCFLNELVASFKANEFLCTPKKLQLFNWLNQVNCVKDLEHYWNNAEYTVCG